MSKQDNLTDFLTDVADAIREKKGITEKINPQNFSEEIRGIESGGGIVPSEFKDVNFYDYEGTILYSYTWDEFVAKNEMPPLPTHHEGLTCQEWNYTLEEVLEQGGRCDVGAIYIPTDGATHIILNGVLAEGKSIYIKGTGTAHIDWGDGNSLDVQGEFSAEHVYGMIGDADISISSESINVNKLICYHAEAIHIGNSFSYAANALSSTSITKMTFPNTTVVLYNGMVAGYLVHLNIPRAWSFNTYANPIIGSRNYIRKVILPNNVTGLQWFSDCSLIDLHIPSMARLLDGNELSLGYLTLASRISVSKKNANIRTDGNLLLDKDDNLVRGVGYVNSLPTYITTLRKGAFYRNCNIIDVTLHEGIVSMGAHAFMGCLSLKRIVIPSTVTSIESQTFYGNTMQELIIFSTRDNVPILKNINAFQGIPTSYKIVVPDALYDEWIAATNWSTYASKIVKASEYVEPTNE